MPVEPETIPTLLFGGCRLVTSLRLQEAKRDASYLLQRSKVNEHPWFT